MGSADFSDDASLLMTLCRCCFAKNPQENLTKCYTYYDKTENYADMFLNCFGVEIPLEREECRNGICSVCVTSLRDAIKFKSQVLRCKEEFIKNKGLHEHLQKKIKTEIEDDDCLNLDDSSNTYDFDPAVLHNTSIKKIPTKLSQQTTTKSKKVGKLSIKISEKSCANRKIKLVNKQLIWKLDSPEKLKYRNNISNLVKYSNCTPFTNRTIHGYTCAFCDEISKSIQELRDHVSSEHKKNLKTKHTGEREKSLKMDITDLKCDLCQKGMNSLKEMKSHLKEHNIEIFEDVTDYIIEFKFENDKQFVCIICQSSFETFRTLLKHMNKHYRNFVCDVCGTGFINTCRLKRHTKSHEIGEHPCRYCGKIFETHIKRDNHEKVHKPIVTKCSHCNETFDNYFKRNKHMKLVHNDVPGNYTCNICNKEFLLSGQLTGHIRKYHLMEKNHACSCCDKSFFQKKDLEKHMVKHTGERNFKCRFCEKAYGRKRTLVEHERIHTNDRRYKCPICGAAFVQKCSMKGHMLSNHSISLAEYELTHKSAEERTEDAKASTKTQN